MAEYEYITKIAAEGNRDTIEEAERNIGRDVLSVSALIRTWTSKGWEPVSTTLLKDSEFEDGWLRTYSVTFKREKKSRKKISEQRVRCTNCDATALLTIWSCGCVDVQVSGTGSRRAGCTDFEAMRHRCARAN